MPGISTTRASIPLGGGGFSWSQYWATRTPSNLATITSSGTAVVLTWLKGEGLDDYDGYKVYISTDGITYTLLATTINEDYTATGLTTGTTYYFKVCAYKGTNLSPFTSVLIVITVNSSLVAGWQFNDISNPFSSTLSNYAIHPLMSPTGKYYKGKTYMIYAGNDDDPYIVYYDHITRAYSTPVMVGTNPLPNGDLHGTPALLIDNNGTFHAFWGAHTHQAAPHSYIQYSKSTDLGATWAVQSNLFYGAYPQLIQFSSGTIYIFYRCEWEVAYSGDNWGYKTSDDNCITWSSFTYVSRGLHYPKFIKGEGDVIHCSIIGNNTDLGLDDSYHRFDVFYLFFNGTIWKDIAGNTLTMPILDPGTEILVYDSTGFVPNSVICCDKLNNPYIFFTESTTEAEISTYNYKIAKYNGAIWDIISIGVATDRFTEYATAIDYVSPNNIDVYLTTGGTADAIGGNLEKWTSTNNGDTWAKVETILSGQYLWPILINDYHSVAKIVFVSYKLPTWQSVGGIYGNLGPHPTTADMKGIYPATLNGVTVVAGKYNNGYNFAGSPQNIQVPDADAFSFTGGSPDKPFSITAWIKATSTAGTYSLVIKGGVNVTTKREYEFCIVANVLRILLLKNASSTVYIFASCPFTSTAWTHIACTYDGGGIKTGLKIYLNAVESQNIQTLAGTYTGMGNMSEPLYIGCYRDSATTLSNYFTGIMDDLKIWNKALSPAEITSIMNNELGW